MGKQSVVQKPEKMEDEPSAKKPKHELDTKGDFSVRLTYVFAKLLANEYACWSATLFFFEFSLCFAVTTVSCFHTQLFLLVNNSNHANNPIVTLVTLKS